MIDKLLKRVDLPIGKYKFRDAQQLKDKYGGQSYIVSGIQDVNAYRFWMVFIDSPKFRREEEEHEEQLEKAREESEWKPKQKTK